MADDPSLAQPLREAVERLEAAASEKRPADADESLIAEAVAGGARA